MKTVQYQCIAGTNSQISTILVTFLLSGKGKIHGPRMWISAAGNERDTQIAQARKAQAATYREAPAGQDDAAASGREDGALPVFRQRHRKGAAWSERCGVSCLR